VWTDEFGDETVDLVAERPLRRLALVLVPEEQLSQEADEDYVQDKL